MTDRSHFTVPPDRIGRLTTAAVALGVSLIASYAPAQPLPVVGEQIRLDEGGGTAAANETTVSVGEANPLEIVAGWNDYRLSTPEVTYINSGFSISRDGGQTWSDILLRPPLANQSSVEGDPMTTYDPRTGMLWAGAISFTAGFNSGVYVARKSPGSGVFHPAVMARVSYYADKCWMEAGPRPGQPDTTRLYVAFNEGLIYSDDYGQNWTDPVSLGVGLGFLPRVDSEGVLYIAYWDADTRMMLKRSLDGGETFTTHLVATRLDTWGVYETTRFPGTFRVPPLLYIDVDPNTGTLYAAYFDTTFIMGDNYNVDIYFTKSFDQGSTWTTPTIVNDDPFPPGDQFFCWIEADKESRLHMVYLDSQHTTQDDDVLHGMFDAYYAYSVNGGDSWARFRLTPNSWDSYDDGRPGDDEFIGDYLGLSVVGNLAYPVYLDTSAGDPDIFINIVQLPLPGDVNGDCVVNVTDLLALLGDWGVCLDPLGCETDLDGSGVIDVIDLLILLGHWD